LCFNQRRGVSLAGEEDQDATNGHRDPAGRDDDLEQVGAHLNNAPAQEGEGTDPCETGDQAVRALGGAQEKSDQGKGRDDPKHDRPAVLPSKLQPGGLNEKQGDPPQEEAAEEGGGTGGHDVVFGDGNRVLRGCGSFVWGAQCFRRLENLGQVLADFVLKHMSRCEEKDDYRNRLHEIADKDWPEDDR
jgi:hypothetical protein